MGRLVNKIKLATDKFVRRNAFYQFSRNETTVRKIFSAKFLRIKRIVFYHAENDQVAGDSEDKENVVENHNKTFLRLAVYSYSTWHILILLLSSLADD